MADRAFPSRRSAAFFGSAAALAGGVLVYATYFPADSIGTEQGDALWLTAMAFFAAIAAWLAGTVIPAQSTKLDRIADVSAWTLAAWVMMSAFMTSPPGNLRVGTNEAWLWVAGAAWWTGFRRFFRVDTVAVVLLIIAATGLAGAVQGLHQHWISLPADRARFAADPDAVLREIRLDAPEGSAERMAFANRLNDGGPIGTFALANSFAAQLLVALVIATGLATSRWSNSETWRKVVWLAGIAILSTCLVATNSRSGMVAGVLGCIAVVVWIRTAAGRSGRGVTSLAWVGLFVLVGVTTLAAAGAERWSRWAPMSLSFRFQYWRSTLALVRDRPWFGAGPGHFQSFYERYREESANEQIADPHHFLMETLAAGGFVAGGLLTALMILGIVLWQREMRGSRVIEPAETSASGLGATSRFVVIGAVVAVVLVWLWGLVSRQLPDVEAQVFALPIAVAWFACVCGVGIVAKRSDPVVPVNSKFADRQTATAAGSVLLLHLCVSGGWTVAGIAILVWTLAAMAIPQGAAADRHDVAGGMRATVLGRVAIVSVGLMLLVLLRVFSIGPVNASARLIARADYELAEGRLRPAVKLLDQAIDADPWAAEAALYRADIARWSLARSDTPVDAAAEASLRWRQAVVVADARAGDDPAVHRQLTEQVLHLYQRFGLAEDLQFAEGLLRQSTLWSPSHQWHWAQLAEVLRAAGKTDEAGQAARRADTLSRLGDNYQRLLDRQMIMPAEYLGVTVAAGPVRRPAGELLKNLLASAAVKRASLLLKSIPVVSSENERRLR